MDFRLFTHNSIELGGEAEVQSLQITGFSVFYNSLPAWNRQQQGFLHGEFPADSQADCKYFLDCGFLHLYIERCDFICICGASVAQALSGASVQCHKLIRGS